MHPSALLIKDFDYDLPPSKIAHYPLDKRDASKLLVYKGGQWAPSRFDQIADHVPAGSLMVFNETKVVHARLLFRKETGGRIEVFCLEPDTRYADVQTAMEQEHEVYWKCMVGGASKWKDGVSLSRYIDAEGQHVLKVSVEEKMGEGAFLLYFSWTGGYSFAEVLQRAGLLPLPPYMEREAEEEDEQRYQTIFARYEGSVAAPTAALHFSHGSIQALENAGVAHDRVTLHVGAGTFKPVKSTSMDGHEMHAEWIEVDKGFLERLLAHVNSGQKVVAVGTTSARTLESLYWIGRRLMAGEDWGPAEIAVPQWLPYERDLGDVSVGEALNAILAHLRHKGKERLVDRTQIIIAPGYRYRIVDGLVTNFHQPQSTLLLLVAALIGPDWKEMYEYALDHDFRFLSYGDACLLWKD